MMFTAHTGTSDRSSMTARENSSRSKALYWAAKIRLFITMATTDAVNATNFDIVNHQRKSLKFVYPKTHVHYQA